MNRTPPSLDPREPEWREATFVPEPRAYVPPIAWALLVVAGLTLGVSIANFAALLFVVAGGR